MFIIIFFFFFSFRVSLLSLYISSCFFFARLVDFSFFLILYRLYLLWWVLCSFQFGFSCLKIAFRAFHLIYCSRPRVRRCQNLCTLFITYSKPKTNFPRNVHSLVVCFFYFFLAHFVFKFILFSLCYFSLLSCV